MNPSYSVDEIIDAFCRFDGAYRRTHVDAALAMREEITPRLIELLELVRSDPQRYADDEDFAGHIYAVMLLAHFGETRAHQLIVDLFSLPSALVDALWGDMITEDLPTLLYRTCGGSLEQIKALAKNRKAEDFCRSSALGALNFAVADGVADREEIVQFFGTLLDQGEAPWDSSFWGLLVTEALDLHPTEILPQIKRAFDDDMIDTAIIDYEYVLRALKESPEAVLNRVRQELRRHTPANFHQSMEWWAMFEPKARAKTTKPIPPAPTKPTAALTQETRNVEALTRQQRRKLEREVAKKGKKQKGKRR